MERRISYSLEKQQEGMAKKQTGKSGKSSLEPWYYKYKHPEQTDNQRELHGDPRGESHGQHQRPDSNFTSSDEESDHQSLHPASGFGATHDLSARDPSASDRGTLAGGAWLSSCFQGLGMFSEPQYSPPHQQTYKKYMTEKQRENCLRQLRKSNPFDR